MHLGDLPALQGFTKKAEGPRTPVVASALVGSGRKRKRSVRAPPQLRCMQLPRTYNPLQLPSSSAAGGAEGAAPQEMTAYEQSDGFWGAEASLVRSLGCSAAECWAVLGRRWAVCIAL